MAKEELKSGYVHYIKDVDIDRSFPDNYNFILVESMEQLRELLKEPVNLLGFDIETTGLNSETDDIVSYSFAFDKNTGYNVPCFHDAQVNGGNPGLGEEALDLIYDYMLKCKCVVIHNYMFESRMMEWHGYTSLPDKYKSMWQGLIPFEENEFFTKDKVCHFIKYNMRPIKYFDTMISCFLADTNDSKVGLKPNEQRYLGWKSDTFEETLGEALNFKYTDYRDESIIRYCCLDAMGALGICLRTKKFYDEAKMSGQIDMAFAYVLTRCYTILQRLDKSMLESYEEDLTDTLRKIEQQCWEIAGRPFKMKSVKEKGEVFDSLGLNTGEVGKSGRMKTGKKLLEKMRKTLPPDSEYQVLLKGLINFGILSTVKNNFVKNLLDCCDTSRPHPSYTRFNYKTCFVQTGRLSASGDKKSLGFVSNTNIQNIPKPHPADYHAISIEDCKKYNPELVQAGWDEEKQEYKDTWKFKSMVKEGKENKIIRILDYLFVKINWMEKSGAKWPDEFPFNNEEHSPMIEEGADPYLNMRNTFLPFSDDDYILSFDYAAQELRIAALLSGEPVWCETFATGGDPHKATAFAVFGEENYDKEKRKLSKGINFGILYGMEAYSLYSRGIAKTPEEGELFYNKFKEGLPVLFKFMEGTVRKGQREGTVYTMFGRPRRVHYWCSSSDMKKKSFGSRTCKNTIIQGTGADITKLALIKVFNNILSKPGNRDVVRFMSTVHDEINYSVKKDKVRKVAVAINKLMSISSANWPFGFETGLGIGLRWGEVFDFNYDKETFEIKEPLWDALWTKPAVFMDVEEEVIEDKDIEDTKAVDVEFDQLFGDIEEDGEEG